MGNRRLTYPDLRGWLVAEAEAIAEERRGRVLGRRGKDGETVYEKKPRDFITSGPASADLVAEYAGRDRKTVLSYRKADWPKSAWLPLMTNDFTWTEPGCGRTHRRGAGAGVPAVHSSLPSQWPVPGHRLDPAQLTRSWRPGDGGS